MKPTTASLTCEAAIALADQYFGLDDDGMRRVRMADAQLFATGQLTAWDAFAEQRLSAEELRRIGRLLVHRPQFLANRRAFIHSAQEAISSGLISTYHTDPSSPGEWVLSTHSGNPEAVFSDAIGELDSRRDRGKKRPVAEKGHYGHQIHLATDENAVISRIPLTLDIADADAAPPVLRTTPATAAAVLDLDQLTALAEDLDRRRGGGYLGQVTTGLAARLRDKSGAHVQGRLVVPAGPTVVLNAPTGSGKSVLFRLAAVDAARRGVPIAVLVADIATTLALAHDIRSDLAMLGSEASVVPLVSVSRQQQHAANALARPPAWDPDGEFTRHELGYGCALAGATSAPMGVRIPPGDEPCRSLRDDDGRSHDCPLLSVCEKHRLARAAVTADVVITNHANFQAGRLQIPVGVVDGDTTRRLDRPTVAELLMRRAELLLIDEIDSFQIRAAASGGRVLTLADRRSGRSPLLDLDEQRRAGVAAGYVDSSLEGVFHTCLNRVQFLAERYLAAASAGQLGVSHPGRRAARRLPLEPRLHLPRRWDNLLAARLGGQPESESPTEQSMAMLAACFPDEDRQVDDQDLADDRDRKWPDLAAAAAALAEAIGQDTGADRITAARLRIDTALRERLPDPDQRIETVDLLLHRAFLEQLRQQLQRLVNLLPLMRDAGIDGVNAVEEVLGRTRTWHAAPWGPLGRIVFAFGLRIDPDDPRDGELTVEIVGGDPHGYVADLGLTTAVALAGQARPVLGVSATAFFPGAAGAHIHRPVSFYAADDLGGAVSVAAATVLGSDGAPIRISGTDRDERGPRLRELGAGLWPQHLSSHLAQRVGERDPKALCVVNSYDHAIELSLGIASVLPETQRARIAVAAPVAGVARVVARVPTGMIVLAADDLQSFPDTGADILIAPYGRVNRGLNIVTGTTSAITSIWACIRPMPVVDTPSQMLAHVGARAHEHARASDDPVEELRSRSVRAARHQQRLITAPRTFTTLPLDVREDVIAGVLVELIQLIGRARRGNSSAALYLVDNAFHQPGSVPGVDLATLLQNLKKRWQRNGQWALLSELHTATFSGLYDFADRMTALAGSR